MNKEEKYALWLSLSLSQRLMKSREQAIRDMDRPDYNAAIVARAQKRMDRVDAFPADVRAVIYEHGLETVQEFWNHGVRKAKSISHLIATARGTDFANGQPRFGLNRGPNTKSNSLNRRTTIAPLEPTSAMIQASMAEVSTFDQRITKTEKHRRRLRAALLVAKEEFGLP